MKRHRHSIAFGRQQIQRLAGLRHPITGQPHNLDAEVIDLLSLAPMAEGTLLADTIASIAMLDPILGGVDR